MKMVKSLLLGSAAGLVAVAGAQAADLPVKAKAVEYVKICSLYGKGFYYIPGSDVCLSITGFVRFQVYSWDGASGTSNTANTLSSTNVGDTRTGQNSLGYRARTMMTFDVRNQTAYGTLRAVATTGYTTESNTGGVAPAAGATAVYANRGFIQLAGFTLGKATSFFDFYQNAAVSYFANSFNSDTGDTGWMVAAYTAQFGGGFSATVALEEPRRTNIVAASTAYSFTIASGGATDTSNYSQQRMSDVVGNLRWDQNWGAIQVMGAWHDVTAGYYTATSLNSGHPGDTSGWAAGVGGMLRIGPDILQASFIYTVGAGRYLNYTSGTNLAQFSSGGAPVGGQGSFGYGIMSDGVYITNGSIDLTTAWGINASYDHRWSPTLKTSVYGTYAEVSYGATANANLCAAQLGLVSGVCNQDWQFWSIGSRTQWDVARNFYIGVDVMYQKIQSASGGSTWNITPGGPRPAGTYAIADQEAWAVTFRAHRDILP